MIRALIGAVIVFVIFATPVAAQSASTGIQSTGTGTASAPAQTAHLQILLGSRASFGMGPMEFDPGTPGPGMDGLSSDHLDPVVDAIADTGVGTDAIVVSIPANNSMFGPGGPETAEIRATIVQPTSEGLIDLVSTIGTVAQESGLTVLHVGARYEAVDCVALTQRAREAAIADAKVRAEGLAQGLGLTLGELTQASEPPYSGPAGMDSCAAPGAETFGSYGPGTDPAFDPEATEASVTVQVTLTYAFGAAA